jgi:hypothetical protein
MDQLPVTARIALPEPLGFPTFFRRDGQRGVAVGERTGRLWMLEIDPGTRTGEANPLPVTVPRTADGKGWLVRHLSGSRALDRLLLCSEGARVYAVPSGEVVAELSPLPGRAVCLSPDGEWVLCLSEGKGAFRHLDSTVPAWRQWMETSTFHELDRDDGSVEEVVLDHVDGVVAHACGDDDETSDFWIAAGCYGEAISFRAYAAPLQGELRRIRWETHVYGGFVYDPIEMLHPSGERHVFLLHGYGTGLAALDPATGEVHHCWVRGPRQQPYAFFSGVVPCGTAPIAWARCSDGDFLWRVGQPPTLVPKAPGYGIALFPHALLCLSNDGGELLWCNLPPG